MELPQHYQQLWENAEAKLLAGNVETDPFLDTAEDTRRGITLLARPAAEVQTAIQVMLQELAQLDPRQYYYPTADLHLTVLSIISCYPGFTLDQIQPQDYKDKIEEALEGIQSFEINYRGITASPASILVQGFPGTDSLAQLRDRLRKVFKSSGLPHSIDQRYVLQTAHSTVVRFSEPLTQPARFVEKLRQYRTHSFGVSRINTLELVYNDWYQRQANTRLLGTFTLK